MGRYSEAVKADVRRRMSPPHRQSVAHISRLMDDAHTGETIVLAKAGRLWARLMPLEP